VKVVLQLSDIVPANPFARRPPPDENATLTVTNIGPDPEMALLALQALTERSRHETLRFEGVTPERSPVSVTLPSVHYDDDNGLVRQLRKTGCEFTITTRSWVCPREMQSDDHLCRPTCSTVRIAEVLS